MTIEQVSGVGQGDDVTEAMRNAEANLQKKLERRIPFEFVGIATTHAISAGVHYYTITYVIRH